MTFDEIYTEDVLQKEAAARAKWHLENDRRIEVLLAFADRVMETKDDNGIKQLLVFLKKEEQTDSLTSNSDLLYVYLGAQIFCEENEYQVYPTIFHACNSVQDMIGKLRQIKFYFWEYENQVGQPEELLSFIRETNLSICSVYQMMQCANVDGMQCLQDLYVSDEVCLSYLKEKALDCPTSKTVCGQEKQDSIKQDAIKQDSEKQGSAKQDSRVALYGGEKKFCFIMCTNDAQYEQECLKYISQIHIPNGYEVDYLSVLEATSMTSGYNEAMEATDAKYKIYLHQDVMIVNKNILYDILQIFEDDTIGMIGMVGCPELPKCGVQWYTPRVGRINASNIISTFESDFDIPQPPYEEVELIDGMMMITQYDLRWREDLFTGFDFYDSSQSREFKRAGYKVVVPYMEKPWVIHDDGIVNLNNYEQDRKKFVKEYITV